MAVAGRRDDGVGRAGVGAERRGRGRGGPAAVQGPRTLSGAPTAASASVVEGSRVELVHLVTDGNGDGRKRCGDVRRRRSGVDPRG